MASAVAQTYEPAEILCVDDGSTDGTLEVLARLEAAHPTLVRVLRGSHGGASAARNRGLAQARGTFIQFLDADDELAPDKLARQLDIAQATGADIIASGYRRRRGDDEFTRQPKESRDPWVNLVYSRLGITSANLWRRSTLERVGGWNEAWASSQEYELMFRLLKSGAQVAYDSEVRTMVWSRPSSITSSGPQVDVRFIMLRASIIEYLTAEGMMDEPRRSAILEYVFTKLRALYRLDRQAALGLHRRAIPRDYVPSVPANRRLFVATYRLFGLDVTERLRTLVR